MIGASATLNVNVTVGEDSLVGVGTTVIKHVGSGKRVIAMPRLIESDIDRQAREDGPSSH